MTDAERFCEDGITCWAGPLAQARAGRPNKDGWVRSSSWERIKAIHEAAHAVVAAAVGTHAHYATIIPNKDSEGHCIVSRNADFDMKAYEKSKKSKATKCDRSQAVRVRPGTGRQF
jgi:ATP-dependent Zn protease